MRPCHRVGLRGRPLWQAKLLGTDVGGAGWLQSQGEGTAWGRRESQPGSREPDSNREGDRPCGQGPGQAQGLEAGGREAVREGGLRLLALGIEGGGETGETISACLLAKPSSSKDIPVH